MATKVGSGRSYEEFEPFWKWEKDECSDIVDLCLKGFGKEQLKVILNRSAGILIITGEHQLEGNKWSRFRKEIKASDNDFKTNEIRAKFSSGVLRITMPRKPVPPCKPNWFQRLRRRRLAVGEIVAVVTVLVLTAVAYGTHKYCQLHRHIEN